MSENVTLTKVGEIKTQAQVKAYLDESDQKAQWRASEAYASGILRAMETYRQVKSGRMRLTEALSTPDFTYLFADILDRKLLANFEEFPSTYEQFCRIERNIRDFRDVKRKYLDKGDAAFTLRSERAEPEERPVSDGEYSYSVSVYEAVIDLDWEDIVNDDLGALESIPERLARGARRAVAKFVTGLYLDSSGPISAQFSASATATLGANLLTGNPALSLAAIKNGMELMSKQRDPSGEPIWTMNPKLVIAPALQVTAMDILSSLSSEQTASGGTAAQILHVQNWVKQALEGPYQDPYIPIVCTSNPNTPWFLFADPNKGRPAIEVGFLSGFDTPALYMKASDLVPVGGAPGGPMMGSFENGSLRFKGRMVFGGKFMEKRSVVGSNGSGS